MFTRGDHDLITRLEGTARPTVGDQVDRFGGVSGKDHRGGIGSVQKPGYLAAGKFVHFGSLDRQGMSAAVNVGMMVEVIIAHRLDHLAGLLRRSGVVEVDERLAVHFATEDGEVLAQGIGVEAHGVSLT